MPIYRNISTKTLFVSGTAACPVPASVWIEDANCTVVPGATEILSEQDAATLAERVTFVALGGRYATTVGMADTCTLFWPQWNSWAQAPLTVADSPTLLLA